ncbi:hypothetical protein [Coxiella endosymbiont of Ornithodoros maritimus]|uniref:hypothetical protein n=1 Tax=Coxiella endosymbiont of Ornithodoros maritimus TaxID=1656172 RepID=UPI002263E1F6|nr:hypothetical protein [Coxiella endosymbiont of Ornithodoros maritimus]
MVTHEKAGVGSLLKQGLRPKEYEKDADEINVKSFVRENVNLHLGSVVVPVVEPRWRFTRPRPGRCKFFNIQ